MRILKNILFKSLCTCIGPPGLKSTSEAVLTLIAGCASSLCGRSFGFLCHENASNAVPLYHVGMASMAIGLSLLLYASADGFAEALPYFAIFGILSGNVQIAQRHTGWRQVMKEEVEVPVKLELN